MTTRVSHGSTRPFRVLHCLRAPVGGLFRHVRDLVEAQAEQGHEVGVICSAEAGDPLTEQHLLRLQRFCKLGLHRIPMHRVPGIADLSMLWRARMTVKQCAPDILHGHGAKGGLIARLVPAPAGARRFYTPHGGSVHVAADSALGIAVSLAERGMLSRTDGISFESEFARQRFQQRFGNLPCATTVVHNGVRPEEFDPISPDTDAADFVYVGEIRALKGVFTLVEAFADVVTEAPEASLAIIGSGPDDAALDAAVRRLGVQDRIRRYDAMPFADALRLGRCGVMPSHHDSLPYVALEMIAAGRPMIATDVGGLPEIFGDSSHVLVPGGSVSDLSAALQGFLTDPDKTRRQMERVRDRVRHHFSMSQMATGIDAFYRQVFDHTGHAQDRGNANGCINSHVESAQ